MSSNAIAQWAETATVRYRRDDGSEGSTILALATCDYRRDVAYYLGLGYAILRVEHHASCGVCSGLGWRPHKRYRGKRLIFAKRVKCEACCGVGERVLPDLPRETT